MRIILLISVFVATISVAPSAMATDFRQLRGSDLDVAEAAMVSIYCRIGDTNRATVSSGVVIKGPTDNRRGEVIVTTGHGVGNYDPTDLRQDCWVALDGGTRYRIHRIANSTDMAGASQDWAVVTTSAPFAEAVVRLPAVTLESIDYGVLPVAMFGRHFSNFDCRLNLNSRIVSDGQRVFLHDCGSERGQSGAPLVARVDGEISVIALNLGRVTNSQDPDAELLALALGLDGGFLAVLDGALRDVSLPAQ